MNLDKTEPFVKIVNEEDRKAIETLIHDTITKYAIPSIESRLVVLYNQYLQQNKGSLTDTVKKLLKSKTEFKSPNQGYKMN